LVSEYRQYTLILALSFYYPQLLKFSVMAKKQLLKDFTKNALTKEEALKVKGGKNYVPGSSGSYGYINWDDVDIRDEGFVVQPVLGFTKLSNKKGF